MGALSWKELQGGHAAALFQSLETRHGSMKKGKGCHSLFRMAIRLATAVSRVHNTRL
jgi:hypothetical protein